MNAAAPALPAPALRLAHLGKRFGALAVTRDVTLDVHAGEIHALIGPNGAGKTTLMAQIAGQLRPDTGRVWLAGTDVTHWPPHRRAHQGLARTFQISSVFPSLSACENVMLALNARARRTAFWRPFRHISATQAATQALQRLDFSADPNCPASMLDYGSVRQIELAMCLAASGLAAPPKVLLLDEPLAGLSPMQAEQMAALLGTLRGQFGLLLIEHDMNAVFAIADRITVMVEGRILASGTPGQIRADAQVRKAYLGEASA